MSAFEIFSQLCRHQTCLSDLAHYHNDTSQFYGKDRRTPNHKSPLLLDVDINEIASHTSLPSKSVSKFLKRDAYMAFPPSPDSEWSTLAPGKRQRTASPSKDSKFKVSGKFTLPGSLLGMQHGMKSHEPSASSANKTKISVYLPPPPASVSNRLSERLQAQDREDLVHDDVVDAYAAGDVLTLHVVFLAAHPYQHHQFTTRPSTLIPGSPVQLQQRSRPHPRQIRHCSPTRLAILIPRPLPSFAPRTWAVGTRSCAEILLACVHDAHISTFCLWTSVLSYVCVDHSCVCLQ